MTEATLIQEIQAEITQSCALPYGLPETEIKRIIKVAKEYFWQNYQYAVEARYIGIPREIFDHPDFLSNRVIQMPDCVVSVYELRESSGFGFLGNPDRDFSDSKLLGSEIFLSPFQGDNLVYRTAMYSYFDLAKAFLLETVAYDWNRNTKRITVLGRNPFRDCITRCLIKIPEDTLYDDELFRRYCYAKAKIHLGRTTQLFNYNLPGGVTINFSAIKEDGQAELDLILKQIDDENQPDWFIQWN
jgi:hypothetical protein